MANGYLQKHYEGPVKRYVQTLELKDDPELIRQYRHLHSPEGAWPEILEGIRACGILEMEIYILGPRLVMIVDAPADLDWEAAMTKMASLPRQAEWEAVVAHFQRCAADARSDEKWQMMERMFYLYE